MKNCNRLIAIVLILSTTLISCKKDEIPPQPDLPPENAFVNDFSGFGESASRSQEAFAFAALNVAVWNTLLYLNLVVPVTAWYAVREVDPVWNKTYKAWIWSKTFNLPSGNYVAELRATVSQSNVIWEMVVSKDGGFQNFLWYSGVSDIDASEGKWLLYKNPSDPIEYIEIEWSKPSQDHIPDVKYINAIPNHSGNGGYIHYGPLFEERYNVFYDIYQIEEDRLIEIRYHRDSAWGQVRDDVYFGNELWHCWDSDHNDIDCP
ncbi:MAG: hypothetical protein Kow0075_06570 [Salibacteraceae bacterium]